MMSLPVWLPGQMFLLGGLCLWSHVLRGSLPGGGGSLSKGACPGDVSVQGGSLSVGVSVGRPAPPPRMRKAGGMLSFLSICSFKCSSISFVISLSCGLVVIVEA